MRPEKDRIALQLRLVGEAAAEGGRKKIGLLHSCGWEVKRPPPGGGRKKNPKFTNLQTYKRTRFDTRFFLGTIRALLQKARKLYFFKIIPQ